MIEIKEINIETDGEIKITINGKSFKKTYYKGKKEKDIEKIAKKIFLEYDYNFLFIFFSIITMSISTIFLFFSFLVFKKNKDILFFKIFIGILLTIFILSEICIKYHLSKLKKAVDYQLAKKVMEKLEKEK